MTLQILTALNALVFAALTVREHGNGSVLYFIYPLALVLFIAALLVQTRGKHLPPAVKDNATNA